MDGEQSASVNVHQDSQNNEVAQPQIPVNIGTLPSQPSFDVIRFSDVKNGDFIIPLEEVRSWLAYFRIINPPQNQYHIDGAAGGDMPLKKFSLTLLRGTSWFPMRDDPYMMGKTACAVVLSDLYTGGVRKCGKITMLISVDSQLNEQQRKGFISRAVYGFSETAVEAGVVLYDCQIRFDRIYAIGGIVWEVEPSNNALNDAVAGDVVVLTKPLGTQTAISAYQWRLHNQERWNIIKTLVEESQVIRAFTQAMSSMARLNLTAAELMYNYNVHAVTDLAGLGLLRHAQKLVARQNNPVSFKFDCFPVIASMVAAAIASGDPFKLLKGLSEDISGGLLLCMPRQEAVRFINNITEREGLPAWIVGEVVQGNRTVTLAQNATFEEIR